VLTTALTFAATILNGEAIQQLQMSTVISNHQHQQLREHHKISLTLLSGHKSSLHLGAFEEQLAFRSCIQLHLLHAENFEQAVRCKKQRKLLTRI